MRLVKSQPEKRLLISVGLVWGQTGTNERAADSSATPTSFPAPTPAALAPPNTRSRDTTRAPRARIPSLTCLSRCWPMSTRQKP